MKKAKIIKLIDITNCLKLNLDLQDKNTRIISIIIPLNNPGITDLEAVNIVAYSNKNIVNKR